MNAATFFLEEVALGETERFRLMPWIEVRDERASFWVGAGGMMDEMDERVDRVIGEWWDRAQVCYWTYMRRR